MRQANEELEKNAALVMKIRDAVLESITYSLMSYSPLKLT